VSREIVEAFQEIAAKRGIDMSSKPRQLILNSSSQKYEKIKTLVQLGKLRQSFYFHENT
jgi:hypothetical protein